MNRLKFKIIAIVCMLFLSCGNSIDKQSTDEKGFTVIEQEIKNKFGNDAYYTDLNISHDNSVGNMISLTVTDAPESLKMGDFVFSQHTSWKQNSDITLEVPQGTKAADFMFQLKDEISLKKLGELVEISTKKLTKEKNIENPNLEMAFIKFPKNGDISKTQYVVKLEPENGGTSFTFYYQLNGDFIEMDY